MTCGWYSCWSCEVPHSPPARKAAVAERMRICTPRRSSSEPMKPNALLSHEPLLNSYDLKFLCV